MSLRVTVTAISKACRNAQTHAPLPHGAWTLRSWTFLLSLPLQCAVTLITYCREASECLVTGSVSDAYFTHASRFYCHRLRCRG